LARRFLKNFGGRLEMACGRLAIGVFGMTRHERFLAQLAELAREYEEKVRPAELAQSRLRWEDWARLQVEAVGFAKEEIRRRRWRGRRGGMLPEGYDAEGVANEAIGEIMEGKGRLAVGFTRERVVNELKRLVSQRVRVLHRLKEAAAVRSEWEDANGDGEGKSLLRGVPAEWANVEEAVCLEEEESWRGRVIGEFEQFLEAEPELRAILKCLCSGVDESREMARRLGMDEATVVKGRKKLARRAGEFQRRLKGNGRKLMDSGYNSDR
jgi:hypothetical protein